MAWLGTYAHRVKVTASNTNVDSDLTHFPLLLTLGTSVGTGSNDVSFVFDELDSSGGTDTIFEDNFNSYTDGDINGQGSWSGDTSFDIQGVVTREGTKAVKSTTNGSDDEIAKSGTSKSEGKMTLYHRKDVTNIESYAVRLYEGATLCGGILFNSSGTISYLTVTAGWVDSTIAYSVDTWHQIEIEWQETGGTNPQYRFRIDGGAWQGFYETYQDWSTGLDKMIFRTTSDAGAMNCYWDYVSEQPIDYNRNKIAVTKTDGTTELYVEIEKFDYSNETAVLWVSKSDWVLDADANTEVYLYYDSAHADNTDRVGDVGSRTEVWDDNYELVLHMTGAAYTNLDDSTSNNNDIDTEGGNPTYNQPAKIGNGVDFDGTGDYISVAFTTPATEATYEAWAYLDEASHSSTRRFVLETYPSYYGGSIGVEASNYLTCYVANSAGDVTASTDTSTFPLQTQTYVAETWKDSGTLYLYKNGAEVDNTSLSAVDVDGAQTGLRIGTYRGASDRYWNGLIDELRVSNIQRSVAHIKANYYAQTDALVAWGSEEDIPATGTNFQLNISDDWKTVTKIQVNIGDSWKPVTKAQVNIGDVWKTIF